MVMRRQNDEARERVMMKHICDVFSVICLSFIIMCNEHMDLLCDLSPESLTNFMETNVHYEL